MKRAKRKMIREYHEYMGDKRFKILGELKDSKGYSYYLVQIDDNLIIDGDGVDSDGKDYVTELTSYPSFEYNNLCNYIRTVVDVDEYSIFDYYDWLEETAEVANG